VYQLVELFISGASRKALDPILDACVSVYNSELDEDGQIDFKGKAKAFVRTYQFLASILPYTNRDWEVLTIFLNFLIPKLPAPIEEDLSKGILEAIDMDSYRNEVKETLKLTLSDENGEIGPVPTSGGGHKPEPEFDRLSNIIKAFNDQFGNIDWKDVDRIRTVIVQEIPGKVAADKAYQNAMKNSDKAAARLEHDRALQKVVISMLADHTELFKQFSDNPGFKKWLSDTIFGVTFGQTAVV
jgi:type I restriction enzyme R subunit